MVSVAETMDERGSYLMGKLFARSRWHHNAASASGSMSVSDFAADVS